MRAHRQAGMVPLGGGVAEARVHALSAAPPATAARASLLNGRGEYRAGVDARNCEGGGPAGVDPATARRMTGLAARPPGLEAPPGSACVQSCSGVNSTTWSPAAGTQPSAM